MSNSLLLIYFNSTVSIMQSGMMEIVLRISRHQFRH